MTVERWTPASRAAVGCRRRRRSPVLPSRRCLLGAGLVDRLTALFIYVILAAMWNALAGFGGLVSVGQQVFFGLGAYFTIRLADAGIDPFVAVLLAAVVVGVLSLPLSLFMLRLKGGEFAIGMWVIAALTHLLVNLDRLIQGETGTSLISLNAYDSRHAPRTDLLAGAGRDDRTARRAVRAAAQPRRRRHPGDPRQ